MREQLSDPVLLGLMVLTISFVNGMMLVMLFSSLYRRMDELEARFSETLAKLGLEVKDGK